jgi:clostripain
MNKHTVLTSTSVVITLLLLLAQTMPVLAASQANAPTQAKWTFMVYLNGDNNLEKYVTSDIETELAQPGSNADVNVVALADRIPGYNSSAGNWTSTKLFYVTKGMQATPQNALADWGERNMGDPRTLTDFVRWAKTSYPADHYALIFWDHGWGWRPGQTMWDKTSQDALDPDEIITAMKGVGPVDVIGYDACEGQMIETGKLVFSRWTHWDEFISAYVNNR